MEKLTRIAIAVASLGVLSCQRDRHGFQDSSVSRAFDAGLWQQKKAEGYTYRDEMLNDLFATDTLKRLDKAGLLRQLGPADRTDGPYLFYEIVRTKAAAWTLHTKTLVVELEGDSVKTVRLHE